MYKVNSKSGKKDSYGRYLYKMRGFAKSQDEYNFFNHLIHDYYTWGTRWKTDQILQLRAQHLQHVSENYPTRDCCACGKHLSDAELAGC